MSVERIALSLEPALAKKIRRAAGDNLSAWMANAAEAQLRQEALKAAVSAFEDEEGKISETELKKVRKKWG